MKLIKRIKGFTLMEVMIVVAIIGILAAIGIPSYRKYVIKAHRKEAISHMMNIVGLLEKEYGGLNTGRGQYTAAYVATLNADNNINRSPAGSTGTGIRYNINISQPSGTQTYLITATPNGANDQSQDICGILSINQAGLRIADGAVDPACF